MQDKLREYIDDLAAQTGIEYCNDFIYKPNAGAIEDAKKVLDIGYSLWPDLEPYVGPCPEGGIAFEWQHINAWELIVYVAPRSARYLIVGPGGATTEDWLRGVEHFEELARSLPYYGGGHA